VRKPRVTHPLVPPVVGGTSLHDLDLPSMFAAPGAWKGVLPVPGIFPGGGVVKRGAWCGSNVQRPQRTSSEEDVEKRKHGSEQVCGGARGRRVVELGFRRRRRQEVLSRNRWRERTAREKKTKQKLERKYRGARIRTARRRSCRRRCSLAGSKGNDGVVL